MLKQVTAAIAVVIRQGQVLVCQRRDNDFLGGMWEFPGGKQEPGESLQECLHRELAEEIDIRVRCLRALTPVQWPFPDRHVTLCPFLCELTTGEPKLIECQAARWIAPIDLRSYNFPKSNAPLIEEVIELLHRRNDNC